MLDPVSVNLTVWRSGSFDTEIQFWDDAAHKAPHSLAGLAVSIKIEGGPTLTEGSGISVAENKIIISLTTAQTEALAGLTRAHYAMKWVGTKTDFPIRGIMSFETP